MSYTIQHQILSFFKGETQCGIWLKALDYFFLIKSMSLKMMWWGWSGSLIGVIVISLAGNYLGNKIKAIYGS